MSAMSAMSACRPISNARTPDLGSHGVSVAEFVLRLLRNRGRARQLGVRGERADAAVGVEDRRGVVLCREREASSNFAIASSKA